MCLLHHNNTYKVKFNIIKMKRSLVAILGIGLTAFSVGCASPKPKGQYNGVFSPGKFISSDKSQNRPSPEVYQDSSYNGQEIGVQGKPGFFVNGGELIGPVNKDGLPITRENAYEWINEQFPRYN